jgi:hypothetical protein
MSFKLVRVTKSNVKGKKYTAHFVDSDTGATKKTHFGAAGMEDLTTHKDPERARLYRARHQKDLKTNDPTRAGYLSYYLLWSTPDFERNIREYKNRFNL